MYYTMLDYYLNLFDSNKREFAFEATTRADYDAYDLLIGMDDWNLRNIRRITGGDPDGKIFRLLDFTDRPREVDDPWYTREFERCYDEIREGCEALLRHLTAEEH